MKYGYWVLYNENGTKTAEISYWKDEANGPVILYFNDGQVHVTGSMTQNEWDRDKKVLLNGKLKKVSFYSQGKNGEEKLWTPQGELDKHLIYVDDGIDTVLVDNNYYPSPHIGLDTGN